MPYKDYLGECYECNKEVCKDHGKLFDDTIVCQEHRFCHPCEPDRTEATVACSECSRLICDYHTHEDKMCKACHRSGDFYKCVACNKRNNKEDQSNDSEHGVMGRCRTCDKCFACADCISGWTHKERYYCTEHEGDYDETNSEWATPASSKQSSQDYEAQVERHMEMLADIARGK